MIFDNLVRIYRIFITFNNFKDILMVNSNDSQTIPIIN